MPFSSLDADIISNLSLRKLDALLHHLEEIVHLQYKLLSVAWT